MTMNLLPRLETTIFPIPNPVTHRRGVLLPLRVTSYFRSQTSPKRPIKFTHQHQTLPIAARDRVIEFGKYKGRMLGTLPSSYLKWVSKNLRAREMEEWAKLADQVLEDPVYKDRMEWEFAQNVLSGNRSKVVSPCESSAVDELMDISERFGWDNQDKKGWANIKFELLGTSKGGRIPRLEKREEGHSRADHDDTLGKEKQSSGLQVLSGVGERRKERRERQKKKTREKRRGSFVNGMEDDRDVVAIYSQSHCDEGEREMEMEQKENGGNGKPFPGREALLRKVLNRR